MARTHDGSSGTGLVAVNGSHRSAAVEVETHLVHLVEFVEQVRADERQRVDLAVRGVADTLKRDLDPAVVDLVVSRILQAVEAATPARAVADAPSSGRHAAEEDVVAVPVAVASPGRSRLRMPPPLVAGLQPPVPVTARDRAEPADEPVTRPLTDEEMGAPQKPTKRGFFRWR